MSAIVFEVFGRDADAYTILGVARTASTAEVKRAFYKAALQWHPDKNPDPAATKTFQALSYVHSVLNDETKRREYDRSGGFSDPEEEIDEESFARWCEYWRQMFPPITVEQITAFEEEYRGSEEERADVLRVYESSGGDMEAVMAEVMCSRDEDEERFVSMIHAGIASGRVRAHTRFTDVYRAAADDKPSRRREAAQRRARAARTKKSQEEAAEAEELLKEMRKEFHGAHAHAHTDGGAEAGSFGELQAMILARNSQRSSALDALEAKYAATSTSGKRRAAAAAAEPPTRKGGRK